jgi:hypothetical protein
MNLLRVIRCKVTLMKNSGKYAGLEEHFHHTPLPSIAEGNRSRAMIVDRSFDDEEETDSDEYSGDKELDHPAPSIRSP